MLIIVRDIIVSKPEGWQKRNILTYHAEKSRAMKNINSLSNSDKNCEMTVKTK